MVADTARDIIARVIHDELAGSESEHGYGCDHRAGRQPQCGRAADEAMEKIAAEPTFRATGTAEECEALMAREGRHCANPAEHEPAGVNLLDPDDTWTVDDDEDLDRGIGPDRYPPLIRDADGRVTDVG